jgi:hypothetical protein
MSFNEAAFLRLRRTSMHRWISANRSSLLIVSMSIVTPLASVEPRPMRSGQKPQNRSALLTSGEWRVVARSATSI